MDINTIEKILARHVYSDTSTYLARHDHGTNFVPYCKCGKTYEYKPDGSGLRKHVAEEIVKAFGKHDLTEAVNRAFNR